MKEAPSMKPVSLWLVRHVVTGLCAFTLQSVGFAQDLPSSSQTSPTVEAQLRQLLRQPLPSGLIDKEISQRYQELESATFKLNDRNERERVLRDWWRAQPNNLSPRWNLGMLLIEKGSGANEGFAIMEKIYQDTKDQIAAIRVRIKLAETYLDYGKYQNAQRMLAEANGLLTEELKRQRGPEGRYWQVRSQMESAITQAKYFSRPKCQSVAGKFQSKHPRKCGGFARHDPNANGLNL
jgi:hypothetical protein